MNKEWFHLIANFEVEGARTRFENICTTLYKKLFSDRNVRKVEVKQGDGGIDIFIGEISLEPISVIQCKFFPTGIGESQKSQIRASFTTVMSSKEFKVKEWTLCVMNTLDKDEHQWWSGWKKKMQTEHGVNDAFIKLTDGGDLIDLITKNGLYNILFEKEDSIKINEIFKSVTGLPDVSQLKEIFRKASFYISKLKNHFGDKPETHIQRKDTEEIVEWVNKQLPPLEKNVLIIEGEKGNGKTVIVRDVYDNLIEKGELVLCIKSDKYYDESPIGLAGKLFVDNKITFTAIKEILKKQDKKLIVIIDQLDALSQTLSSNREYLQNYNRIIAELEDNDSIRIILTVRSFDLRYDANLSIYNNKNYKKIKISVLPVDDVVKVLNFFGISNGSKQLIELLRTPNHLEIYCKLPNKQLVNTNNILSLKDLFDELWKDIVSSKPGMRSKELLYKIANEMYENEQKIIVQNKYNDSYYPELSYLKSNQILIEDDNEIQFFHQTLYDYCFSRQFIDNGNKLESYILENGQGIYIRSVIKMIIEYLRDADAKQYINTLQTILTSPIYRFHIKTLLLLTIANFQKPTEKEKQLIRELVTNDDRFKNIFLSTVQSQGWAIFVIAEDLFRNDLKENIETVWQFFRKNIGYHPLLLTQYLEVFDFFESKEVFIQNALGFNNNWAEKKMLPLFEKYIPYSRESHDKNFGYCDILLKVANYHLDFVLEKIKNILLDVYENYSHDFQMDNHLSEVIDKIYLLNPTAAFDTFWYVYQEVIKKTIYRGSYEKVGSPFYSSSKLRPQFIVDDAKKKVKDYLFRHIHEMAEDRNNFLPFYNKNKNADSLITLCFLVYGLKTIPAIYKNEILELFGTIYDKNGLKASDDYFQFDVRKLLGEAFIYFSNNDKISIVNLTADVTSISEEIYISASPDNLKTKTLKNNIGRKKYLFLKSLPYQEIKKYPDVNRIFHELSRKFEPINDQTFDHSNGTSGGIVQAPLPNDAYQHMLLADWEKSMIKFNESYTGDWGSLKGGLHQHAKAFYEAVKIKPSRFGQFIEGLSQKKEISKSYVLSGLEGLLDGKYDIEHSKTIFKSLLKHHLDISLLHGIIHRSAHFIDEGHLDEDIFSFLKNIANGKDIYKADDDECSRRNGLSSVRSAAIWQVMGCNNHMEHAEDILATVENAVEENNRAINLVVIKGLALLNHLDIYRAFHVFKKLVDTGDQEILKDSFWSAHYFNNKYHFEMYPYFDKIIGNQELHKDGNIFVISWLNEEINDRPLYERFVNASAEAKLCAIHIAEHNLFDSSGQLDNRSLSILYQFLKEEEVTDRKGGTFADAYSGLILRKFKDVDQFPAFLNFFDEYACTSHCKQAPAYFLQYLISCSKQYPIECLGLLKKIDLSTAPDIRHSGYYREEPVQLILAIHSVLARRPQLNRQGIEDSLDLFDELLKLPHLREAANTAIEIVLQ